MLMSCISFRLTTAVTASLALTYLADPLQAFADILASNEDFSADMSSTYKMLDIEPSSVTTLESYLKEYFSSIMKKLKQVGASSRQTDFYV